MMTRSPCIDDQFARGGGDDDDHHITSTRRQEHFTEVILVIQLTLKPEIKAGKSKKAKGGVRAMRARKKIEKSHRSPERTKKGLGNSFLLLEHLFGCEPIAKRNDVHYACPFQWIFKPSRYLILSYILMAG
jgi:hypothetical protein